MNTKTSILILTAAMAAAQAQTFNPQEQQSQQGRIVVPEGTKVRVRLESNISSATSDEGQTVELSVAEAVRINETTVIAEGARATGTIIQAQEKRRMGRAGKLDFSIDRVKGADNQWIPLRYSVTKKSGGSHAVRTGVITAGVALFVPMAAPVMLLLKGKDVTVNKGIAFEVYTNATHVAWDGSASPQVETTAGANFPLQPGYATKPAGSPAGTATVTVTSTASVAEIEVDGSFVGSTPTTLQLNSGSHRVTVRANDKTWERTVHVSAGSTISLTAVLK